MPQEYTGIKIEDLDVLYGLGKFTAGMIDVTKGGKSFGTIG